MMPQATTILYNMLGAVALIALCGLATIAWRIFIGIWAFRDAKLRGLKLAGLAGVAVAMVPLFIGLIIYICTRPKEKNGVFCTRCSEVVSSDATNCSKCGLEKNPEAAAISVRSPKNMLIGFFISLGVSVALGIAAMVFYFVGIFSVIDGTMDSFGGFESQFDFEERFENQSSDFGSYFENGSESFDDMLEESF